MTNSDIFRIAREQSAIDIGCRADDFLCKENVFAEAVIGEGARCYYQEPIAFNLVSYGNNVVASVKKPYEALVREYLDGMLFYECFEGPSLNRLRDLLTPFDVTIRHQAEYFLPDIGAMKIQTCAYETRILTQADFAPLYTPAWSNALCEKRKERDVLGVGAYDKGELIGLAACSADCETMWQIGIDVLPAYRQQGIASALTSRLAFEILAREKVPFYCAAWSNLPSVRNAIRAGFRPAWVELTVKMNENTTESVCK